jgi:outer membrane protein TolC
MPSGSESSQPVPPPEGAAPTGSQAQAPVLRLSLADAIRLALDSNVEVLVARERVKEAQGLSMQARAALLPNLGFTAQEANVAINLASAGFSGAFIPGIPLGIGPFWSFDSRVRLAQTLLNTSAVLKARSGREGIALARLQEGLAREQVSAAVQVAYINLLRAQRGVSDAEANVTLAESLVRLAERQRNAGIATGLDVTRASTRLAEEQVKLARAQTAVDQAQLRLQHLVGTPMGERIEPTDPLRFEGGVTPPVTQAIEQARADRPEMQVAREQLAINALDVRAAHAEYQPTVNVAADYGYAGETPVSQATAVHNVGIQLNVPIFNGGLTRGKVLAAQSQERQTQLRLNDLGVQVEQDVRSALDSLRTTTAQVEAATRSEELAERELKMARDRFRAGLGDNIELLTAQTAVSDARDALAGALAQYQVARINLSAALGQSQHFQLSPPPTPPPSTSKVNIHG